jgi:glycosyltransferase involved in cell wall biosynthesis
MEFGVAEKKIFVATNVCDTRYHLEQSRITVGSKADARRKLGIDPDCFLALYVGAINKNKRLETMIDAAGPLAPRGLQAIVIGDGDWLERLEHHAKDVAAANVTFPGRIVGDLPYYYKAADIFVLPGRGGIVISESMAYGLPVIVYQADGTEYDLVEHGKTGVRLTGGGSKELVDCLAGLLDQREQLAEWGREGQRRIEEQYNTASMARSVTRCIHYALGVGS